jgi:citrate synthase
MSILKKERHTIGTTIKNTESILYGKPKTDIREERKLRMIKSEQGRLEIKGNAIELLGEISCVVEGLKELFSKELPEREAMMLLQNAFNCGTKTEEEIEIDLKRRILSMALMDMPKQDREKIKKMMEESE